jgi:hypothetical protein
MTDEYDNETNDKEASSKRWEDKYPEGYPVGEQFLQKHSRDERVAVLVISIVHPLRQMYLQITPYRLQYDTDGRRWRWRTGFGDDEELMDQR